MVMRHHVDVVTATSASATMGCRSRRDRSETVDVAPDASRRIVVVARTKALGAELADARKIDPVVVVTPRSPHAARGSWADDIVWADDLTSEERAELEPHVLPLLATTQASAKAGE